MMASRKKGFTLAELLIALAILGVIATFTIPKILDSTTDSKFSSISKEAASMISGAWQSFKLNSSPSGSTTAANLTSLFNYVRTDNGSTSFTAPPSGGTGNCGSTDECLLLHNGAILMYNDANAFGGTNATASLVFSLDPDGRNGGAGYGTFVLMYNGRLTTQGNAGSYTTTNTPAQLQGTDPGWIAFT